MTNFTDNKSSENSSQENAKKQKAKGPIRFEAIIPLSLFLALFYAYFYLFFDSHLKNGLEFAGTYIHGAEVNIADVQTSFWQANFQISGIQITDKEKPQQNWLQLDKVRLELSWDALLRAKLVVKDATIENIMAYAPRRKPGKVLPKDNTESQTLRRVEESVLEQSKEQFNENVLGDVASIVGGVDHSQQLEQIQTALKSDAKIKELENDLNGKKAIWDDRIKNLPQKPQIDALVERSKKLKFNTKDPKQFASDLKQLDQLVREGDKIIKEFSSASKSLKDDVNNFNSEFKSLDQLVKEDIQDLQKRLNIPNINVSDFSKSLFGRMFDDKLGRYKKYMTLARQYMPPKKSNDEKAEAKEEQLVPKQRSQGRDFKFPKQKAYPLFWLKHAHISSNESSSELSGNIKGEIKNATTDPQLLGLPTTIDIEGDFPKQGIFHFQSYIVVDHTTDTPFEKIRIEVGEYPLGRKKLSDSQDVKLALTKAKGNIKISGISRDETIHFLVKNQFNNVSYEIDAKSKIVNEVLTNVTSDLPDISVNAEASGPWSALKWKVNSNLGKELSKGFKKELQAKIDEAKKNLDDYVNSKIKAEKDKLNSQFNQIKNFVDAQLDNRKQELEKAKQQANNELSNKKKGSTGDIKQEAKKAEKKLKKILGF